MTLEDLELLCNTLLCAVLVLVAVMVVCVIAENFMVAIITFVAAALCGSVLSASANELEGGLYYHYWDLEELD